MAQQPIEVFFSYSRKDKELRDELDTHLALLKRRGVTTWHDCQIVAGSEWEQEINRRIKTADIILLLISSDFIASNYCYETELPDILQRHEAREAYVIPVLLRPVAGWKQSPFAKLQICPTGGLPVTQWKDKDAAFVDVADSIEEAVNQLLQKRERERQEQERQEQEKLRQAQEQERLRLEEIRRQQRDQERQAEQARLAEQARIREAEERAKQQRQEQIRAEQQRQAEAEKAKRAEAARRTEEARKQRLAEMRFTSDTLTGVVYVDPRTDAERAESLVERSRYMDAPDPPRQNRREFLKTFGLWSGGSALLVTGLKVWQDRSRVPLKPFDFEVATVNTKGQENPRQRKQVQIFVEDLGNGITLKMASIPGGSFQMGSPANEKSRRDNESPQHLVTVPAFFMGQHEVTQAQYEAITGKNPSALKAADLPVVNVSWNDAQAFCKKLSEKTGRSYRLPSEAEWEYSCRAGTTTPFHFGETITTDLANYQGTDWKVDETTYPGNYGEGPKGKYRGQTIAVGSFPPNALGLYDMHGNVWEWCEDFYHKNYEGAPTNGSAWNVNGEVTTRLLRGGSWYFNPANCRSAIRLNLTPDVRDFGIGFRVVCSSART